MSQAISVESPRHREDRPRPAADAGHRRHDLAGLRADVLQRALRRLLHHPGQRPPLAPGRHPPRRRAGRHLHRHPGVVELHHAEGGLPAERRNRRAARIWIVCHDHPGRAFLGNQAYEWLLSPPAGHQRLRLALLHHDRPPRPPRLHRPGGHGLPPGPDGGTGGDPGELSASRASATTGTSSTSSGSACTVACSCSSRHARRAHATRGTFEDPLPVPGRPPGRRRRASFGVFVPGADAGASGHADATTGVDDRAAHVTTRACGTLNLKGVTNSTPQRGQPFNSSNLFCLNGHLVSLRQPLHHLRQPAAGLHLGRAAAVRADVLELPRQRRQRRQPHGQATIGPNLQGVGAATVDFWVSTGRMPAADVKAVQAERQADPADAAAGARAGGLGQLARPGRPRRAYPHLADGRPVGGPEPVLPQLRGLPHHHRRG